MQTARPPGVVYFCTMTKLKKDWLPLGLMALGLALLLAFQVFWLQKTYRTEKAQFARRSSEILEITVRELYDALSMDRLREEVGGQLKIKLSHEGPKRTINYSTKVLKNSKSDPEDHLVHVGVDSFDAFCPDSARMIVFTQVSDFALDSLPHDKRVFDRPDIEGLEYLIAQAERAPASVQVLLGLADDSLSIDTVRLLYTEKLQTEGLTVPFDLQDGDEIADAGGVTTRPVLVNMLGSQYFTASFPAYRTFLLGQMWEEMLFSLLLFGIISLAFALIYRSLRKQHRLSLLKNDLLSNITHELKTPISSVSVAIEALRDFGVLEDPKLAREYLDISRDELQRLSLLVDRVLRLTTFEQKEPDLQLESLDMADITRTILRTMQVQFDQYEAQHDLEVIGQNFTLNGDRTHLSSVLFNLLDNALKYRNGQQPQVQLRLEELPDTLQISVQDNGIGIPAAYQNRIFEKFFRVPQGNVHNAKGYGLGLSYVAAVVAQHGGKIDVQSKPGQGSRFTLDFPKAAKDG